MGLRPEIPAGINPKLKEILPTCWDEDPDNRPTFKELVIKFQAL